MDFSFRGVEFHSNRIWQLAQVEQAMDFMQRFSMNALIFHQNDLIDQLVFPLKYFSDDLMWKRWPVRMHTIYNNRKYINKIIRDAGRRNIDLYLEVKEISFPDSMLELIPKLRNTDGTICPNNPFWIDLATERIEELCEAVPGLAGIIVSLGTRESKVSISAGECHCERCQNTSRENWYYEIMKALYEPLNKSGKKLIVRDFSYTALDQSMIVQAAKRCSPDIAIALKVTPHDFYPTFPTNPKIGHVGQQPQYVEFDTWGQFYGMGVFPASIAGDIKSRLIECRKKGVNGVWFRTDWEVMYESSVANSLNMLNLYAGAMLSSDTDTKLDDIYRTWAENGISSPMQSGSYLGKLVKPTNPEAYKFLRAFMEASWLVMVKSSYVRGHVFMEDCQTPDTLKKAYDMMVNIHGRDQWEPGASKLVEATKENIKIILEEKTEAKELLSKLPEILNVEQLGLPLETVEELEIMMDLYNYYVYAIDVSAKACFLTQCAINDSSTENIEAAKKTLPELIECKERIIKRLEGTEYPHYIYWLLDESRLEKLHEDLSRLL
jgi:hypothetical protein